ncbi:hypothetical protein BsWGS_21427 [Bradybaena similaris]
MADESRGSFSSEITSPTDLSISSTKASLVAEAPSDASNVQSHTERIQSSQAAEVSKDEMEGNEGKDNGVNTMRTGKRKTCEIADDEVPSHKKMMNKLDENIIKEIIDKNEKLNLQIKKLLKKQVHQDKKLENLKKKNMLQDKRLDKQDMRIEKQDMRLEKQDMRLEKLERGCTSLGIKTDHVDKKMDFLFSKLEMKLDQMSK